MKFKSLLSLIVILVAGSVASAAPVEVGTGVNSAYLYVEWSDGFAADFTVSFDTAPTTGLGLLDIIESETTLTTIRTVHSWGITIDGMAYEGHSDPGYVSGDDWWHYWVKDAGQQDWASSGVGAGDRNVYDDYSDGWIYGRAGAVPEPATMALLALGGLMLRKRRG